MRSHGTTDYLPRVAAAWYTKGCRGAHVVLVTDDAENRKRAESEGNVHKVCSIAEYVRAIAKNPMLADKLKGSEDRFSKDKGDSKRFLFPEHFRDELYKNRSSRKTDSQ